MTDLTREEENLYRRVAEIIEAARSHVARSVNTAMVHAYWHVGRELVEVEQQGKARADYGERLIANLAKRLSERFGRGMGVATLRRIRRFYLTYPTGTAMPSDVSGLEIRSTPLIESQAPEKRSAALIESGPDRALFPPDLGWSHYLVLIRVQDDRARAFYEIEAARRAGRFASWSGRSHPSCSSGWRRAAKRTRSWRSPSRGRQSPPRGMS